MLRRQRQSRSGYHHPVHLRSTSRVDPTIVERIRGQGARVHLPVGAVCNNHCLFCMEEDRASRAHAAGTMTAERVRGLLEAHRNAEEICFTSGEPTTRPELALFIRWARDSGCKRVSLMTNGRRLAYGPYLASLVDAGLNRIYVSIHGDSRALHDSLTRTPGSFEQTLQGLRNAARLAPLGVELHTSTVVTLRNVERIAPIHELLSSCGVHQIVFNAMQVQPHLVSRLPAIMPRYAKVRECFDRIGRSESAYLVDVPLCVTEGLDDRNRGFVERRVHYEAGRTEREAGRLEPIHTDELNERFRAWGPPCDGCRYRSECPGVYRAYVQAFGWDEFEAV